MKKYFLFFLVIFSCALYQKSTAQDNPKKYNFLMQDQFSEYIPVWREALQRFKGKPDIHYLEIGVAEGRATLWMLENILTHPISKATCIDIFPGDLRERFLANIKASGFTDKVITITGRSQIEVRNLPLNSFDVIFIDGSHTANDVLTDAILSWQVLKNEGVIIFDAYLWEKGLPEELRPQIAIEAFLTAYRNYLEVISRNQFQVIIKKNDFSYSGDKFLSSAGYFMKQNNLFSLVGQYLYSWTQRKLYRIQTFELIKLSDIETELIERLIMSRKFGEISFSGPILKNKEFLNLKERLRLDF